MFDKFKISVQLCVIMKNKLLIHALQCEMPMGHFNAACDVIDSKLYF